MNCKKVQFLLDTGSNVTLMTEGCFKRLFGEQIMGDENDLYWLKLQAANGLAMPYVGYALTEVQVGDIVLKDMGILISENDPENPEVLPIQGMNIIVPCWDIPFSKPQAEIQTWPPETDAITQQVWTAAFEDCRRIQAAVPPPHTGTLQPAYRYPVMIPKQSEQVIWARAPSMLKKNQCILVEPLEGPSAVAVAHSLETVQKGRVPIKVRNLNPFPVTLPRYQPVTAFSTENVHIHGPQELTLEQTSPGVVEVGVHQVSQEVVGNILNVEALVHKSDNLSTDEQDQLLGLLTKCGDIFASHDEDFGQTDVIKHTIPTGMAPPIRERYQPIPLNMYQEVRELLNKMIQSGVVRESTSPWAAPIVLVRKKNGELRFCVDY